MKEPSESDIQSMLEEDSIGRNSQLNQLIKFINSFSDNRVISIDGAWGTGKTVFVKQLYHIATTGENDISIYPSLNKPAIQKLRDKYNTYYFNAWENDYLNDPLQAILYELIRARPKNDLQEILGKMMAIIRPVELIKHIPKGVIDVNAETKDKKIISDMEAMVKRKDRISELLNELINNDKRLLFIIDELDRCKPSFAVEFLEVLKHYFNRDDTTFIIATHTTELAHTIQKYYGYGMDGAMYLGKFYDYNMRLRKIDHDNYIKSCLGYNNDVNYFYNSIPRDIANCLGMSMRDMNGYFSALELVSGYIRKENYLGDSSLQRTVKLIFIPLALALQIKHDKRYEYFVQGQDDEFLRELFEQLSEQSSSVNKLMEQEYGEYGSRHTNLPDDFNPVEELKTKYQRLRQGEDDENILKGFQEVTSLIGAYSTINTD